MQSQYQKVMIFSAELSTNSFEKDRQLPENLTSDLLTMQVSFNHALGSYKGTKEVSFIALPKNLDEVDAIMHLVFKLYRQESILMQDNEGISSLYYANGQTEKLGRLVPKMNVEGLDAYMILNGQVWTIE